MKYGETFWLIPHSPQPIDTQLVAKRPAVFVTTPSRACSRKEAEQKQPNGPQGQQLCITRLQGPRGERPGNAQPPGRAQSRQGMHRAPGPSTIPQGNAQGPRPEHNPVRECTGPPARAQYRQGMRRAPARAQSRQGMHRAPARAQSPKKRAGSLFAFNHPSVLILEFTAQDDDPINEVPNSQTSQRQNHSDSGTCFPNVEPVSAENAKGPPHFGQKVASSGTSAPQ